MSQDAKRPFRALIITQDPDHARSLELGLAALDDWDWVRVSGPGEALALLPLNSFTVALMDAADKGGGAGADAHGIAEAVPVIAIASAPGAEGTPPRTQDLDWPHFSQAKLATLLASVAEAQGDALDGLSALDATTNLPAGRLFLEQARHCYGLARRQRTGLAALMLRLDSGDHEEAPAPWRAAATARIRDCLRESDLLGHASTNELAVLFPGVERPEELTALGKRILEGLRSVSLSFGPGIPRPSLGAALMGASPSHVESLLDCARKGVARSQALGGDCLHFDDPRLDEAAAQRFRYEVELRRGLVAGQFTLHWQPQATLGGAVTGAEVLLRWLHPDRGPVPPSEFIPFSESCGFIDALSEWVLPRALRATKALGAARPGFRVAVNLSPLQFRDHGLVDSVLGALRAAECPGSLLCVEVTESSALDDLDEAMRTLSALRDAGIQVALDDFGSGYASVGYLKRLPLDVVKLDRSLVQELGRRKDDERIAELVVAISHKLGLQVVAEGVEERLQWDALQRIGCDQYQGYLLARPQPLEGFERWIHEHANPEKLGEITPLHFYNKI